MFEKYNFVIFMLFVRLQNVYSMTAEDVDSFDRILFAQSWPKAVCLQWLNNSWSHTCNLVKRDTWTVHGIWPLKMGVKKGPWFCKKNWPLRAQELEPIAADLGQLWPNIHGGESASKNWFWAHEWKKHGTCAAGLDSLNSQLKYFSQGLTWLKQYNMFTILKNAGITPSDERTYNVADINEAIHNRLQVKAIIICYKEDGKDVLEDIRLCFDNTLRLVDCVGAYRQEGGLMSNCRSDVYYYDKGPSGVMDIIRSSF